MTKSKKQRKMDSSFQLHLYHQNQGQWGLKVKTEIQRSSPKLTRISESLWTSPGHFHMSHQFLRSNSELLHCDLHSGWPDTICLFLKFQGTSRRAVLIPERPRSTSSICPKAASFMIRQLRSKWRGKNPKTILLLCFFQPTCLLELWQITWHQISHLKGKEWPFTNLCSMEEKKQVWKAVGEWESKPRASHQEDRICGSNLTFSFQKLLLVLCFSVG